MRANDLRQESVSEASRNLSRSIVPRRHSRLLTGPIGPALLGPLVSNSTTLPIPDASGKSGRARFPEGRGESMPARICTRWFFRRNCTRQRLPSLFHANARRNAPGKHSGSCTKSSRLEPMTYLSSGHWHLLDFGFRPFTSYAAIHTADTARNDVILLRSPPPRRSVGCSGAPAGWS